jgi:hypothetical protein
LEIPLTKFEDDAWFIIIRLEPVHKFNNQGMVEIIKGRYFSGEEFFLFIRCVSVDIEVKLLHSIIYAVLSSLDFVDCGDSTLI